MKKLLLILVVILSVNTLKAQLFKIKTPDKNIVNSVKQAVNSNTKKDSLSTNDVIGGLKEALNVSVQKGTQQLSSVDGFFANATLKILMPAEAKKVEESLRKIGMGNQVDIAILNMNRAAEDACKNAAPIFLEAIKGISFNDAFAILRGSDNAATQYLQGRTTTALTTAFRPVIEQALSKIDATKHWSSIFTNYNRFSFNKINPDLAAYVTEKAMSGIFIQLAIEEQKIRKDPMARTTDILKNVFGR